MAQRALGQRTGRAADRSARPRPSPAGRVAVWRAARPARPDPRDRQAARAADPRRARASLDPLARREFLQSLMEVVAEGDMTVVLSSHLIPGNPPPHHLRHQPARLPCPVTRDQHHGPGTQQARASPACATQPPTDRARETARTSSVQPASQSQLNLCNNCSYRRLRAAIYRCQGCSPAGGADQRPYVQAAPARSECASAAMRLPPHRTERTGDNLPAILRRPPLLRGGAAADWIFRLRSGVGRRARSLGC
jgi:hypothetical protein